uniref:putative single-stranded DNA binding protein n=1 Tax=Phymatolithon calcareum TaxID=1277942 RepID=UPI0023F400A5|nr:putative single-stranded DNA binding protein [Phymatolithon calcareum]WEA76928.1 putative single-stranded DNA binding protein [Phymatolithon calcareum]
MNICFITVRIIEIPKRLLNKSKYSTLLKISFPYKKEQLCYATAIVRGKISEDAFDLYFQGDYVIIEGKLIISENMNKNKNLIINIINIHPAHIIMEK